MHSKYLISGFLPLFGLIAGCGGDTTTTQKADTTVSVAEEEVIPEVTKDVVAPPAVPQIPENFSAMSDEEKMGFLIQFGEHVYLEEGLQDSFPPLKGAKTFLGDCKTHAGHIINGVKGEIVIAGQTLSGERAPLATRNNMEVAALITYERNSWGNDYGMCLPAVVAAARN